ncbi:MAG: hypothetical protein IPI67_40130 [Myxococcales bacterium]|nr:hypothetical protein [Myxococcales bacterium]
MTRCLFGLVVGLAVACSSDDNGGSTASTGGASSGGASSGGSSSGGSSSGGSSSGGSSSGGSSSGGSSSGGGAGTGGSSSGGGGVSSGGASGQTLSSKYPGDVGIENDPNVIWVENFEEASVQAVTTRYESSQAKGLSLDAEVPSASKGKASGKFTANGSGPNAVDLYKKLPGQAELYARYYARYGAGAEWHHTGVWLGGYNPASNWPNPQAGLKPNGDDRFSVSFEPMTKAPNPRMDFYNYWMKMHSWMDSPSGNTAYYGNSFVHQSAMTAKDNQWMCIEIHIKLNPSASSGAGAELGLWVNDQSVAQFTDTTPTGYWIKDKFCPNSADGTECTDYKPANPTLVPLDLQYRSTAALELNAFWPQNYITSGGAGSVWYDDMVLAKTRVGCIQ